MCRPRLLCTLGGRPAWAACRIVTRLAHAFHHRRRPVGRLGGAGAASDICPAAAASRPARSRRGCGWVGRRSRIFTRLTAGAGRRPYAPLGVGCLQVGPTLRSATPRPPARCAPSRRRAIASCARLAPATARRPLVFARCQATRRAPWRAERTLRAARQPRLDAYATRQRTPAGPSALASSEAGDGHEVCPIETSSLVGRDLLFRGRT